MESMNFLKNKKLWLGLAGVLGMSLLFVACPTTKQGFGTDDAAIKTYVPPGQYDEFYAFFSGGFSGQMTVYGLPSGRKFRTIPVFSAAPENAYGFSEESKAMLNTSYGYIPWDDAHHPELSMTDGVPDGRYIFINANNTPRIARIDLSRFETDEIIEIPNSAGNHGSPFVTENTEYVIASTRFSVPIPEADVPISSYKENFKGTLTFVKMDPADGSMAIDFQILVPGYDYDLAHAGKGPSHDWAFFTCYNTEQATSLLEVNASRNDKDFIAAVNWVKAAQAVESGKFTEVEAPHYRNYVDQDTRIAHSDKVETVKILNPQDVPGMIYYLPTPKSPHGVDIDPTGAYIVGDGKLSAILPVHSFSKMLQAIEDKEFETTIDGIPVLKYDAVLAGEVQDPGLGPLHTEFDDKGFAYTSAFITSEIVKWKVSTRQVVDRIPTYYSIGHLMIPGGDSKKPWGKYVVALNKITKDRYLPTGPELCQSAQLYDISGDKMKLLLDFPTDGEPHYAQALPADLIKDKSQRIFKLEENHNPYAVKSETGARVVRQGKDVHVYLTAIRSHFMPDNIEGIKLGDTVYWHLTNLEQDWDIPHGFAVKGANNSELLVMPGETRTLKWVPQRVGVVPFYCTDFCSALHQEMQGYVRVSASDADVPIAFNAR